MRAERGTDPDPSPDAAQSQQTRSPGLLLALDTSTAQAGLALYDGRVRAEISWSAGRNHARQLMPAIRWCLDLLGRPPADLTAVAAARGPGSFTGLRVGLAVAQGLAFARALPLYGVGSLDVLAAGVPPGPEPLWAVLDAGRGRFATALYRGDDAGWRRVGDIVGLDLDGLVRLVSGGRHGPDGSSTTTTLGRCRMTGDVTDEARERLAELDDAVWVAPPALSLRRAAVLAEIAWFRHAAGTPPASDDGEPIYLTRT